MNDDPTPIGRIETGIEASTEAGTASIDADGADTPRLSALSRIGALASLVVATAVCTYAEYGKGTILTTITTISMPEMD